MQHSQPPRPQLVYLAFGPATYHQEACFSIVSALAHLGTAREAMDIQVYTDNPQPYAKLPVSIHLLDEAKRQAWNAPTVITFAASTCCCARCWSNTRWRC